MTFPPEQKKPGVVPVIFACLFAGFLLGALFDRTIASAWQGSAVWGSVATGTGRVIGMGQTPSRSFESEDVNFKLFWEMWDTMKQKYYKQPVTDKELFYGAMAGLAGSVEDPYTTFFPPKDAADFQQSLSGKFEGIGAEIGLKDGQLQIVAPLPETPAERAGLMAGDLIIKIDTIETAGMSVEKAVSLIRGDHGTQVTLQMFRPSVKKPPYDVTITREQIQVKSVKWKVMPNQVGYIEVTHFNGDTQENFTLAVNDLLKKKVKGLVLDLRNDPGGFLETSQYVAGAWVGDQVVVKERRQGKIVEELRGTGKGVLKGIPTIVLVNQGSASASEIVAGALQDYHAATIVGMKTFGKGSVQDYQDLSDGSGIKITIAEWLTPEERTINKTGLEPDIVVDLTADDYEKQRDPQLDRALGILNGTATGTIDGTRATSTRL